MWRVESLLLLYVMAGIAIWTWVIRGFPPRSSRRQAGRQYGLGRRRWAVGIIGVGCITLVAVLAAVAGLVDASGAGLALAVLVGFAQLMLVLTFSQWLIIDLRRGGAPSTTAHTPIGDRVTPRLHSTRRRLPGRRRAPLGVQRRSAP